MSYFIMALIAWCTLSFIITFIGCYFTGDSKFEKYNATNSAIFGCLVTFSPVIFIGGLVYRTVKSFRKGGL